MIKPWKTAHIPYNPLSYRGIRYMRQESNIPHAKLRVTYIPPRKRCVAGTTLARASNCNCITCMPNGEMQVSGCTCKACVAYLQAIAAVNYPRFLQLIAPTEQGFAVGKALPNHVHIRRMLHKTLSRFNFSLR